MSDAAIARWRALLGAEHVDEPQDAQLRYGSCTTGATRRLAAGLRPSARAEIPEVLAIAREHRIAVHPISTGRNWGYGTALPAEDDCAVLDLSRLTAIRAVDADLGLFEFEPGVTQGMLAAYLRENRLPFMVPTTGAGPDASLLGNALERGYGITPIADHFAALTRLEAVLADGSTYAPALSGLGAGLSDHAFKWGLGPYLDGLFTQSGLGVVTSATLALARRPERIEAFYFAVPRADLLQPALAAVRSILQELGSIAGSVNLMNRHRVLAMTAPWNAADTGPDGLLGDAAVAALGRRYRIDPWMGMGALYGPSRLVAAARHLIRRRLSGIARRLVFMTESRAVFLHRAASRLLGEASGTAIMLARIRASLDILEGRPNRVAHGLLHWRRGGADPDRVTDPAQAGCGLIWYAPLVPFRPELAEAYVGRCTEVLRRHRMEPLITLSTLSDRCLDSTIPLLFDADRPDERLRAHQCYQALVEACLELGLAPYRLHVDAMGRFTGSGASAWELVRKIRLALDPDDLIAPGRYTPSGRGPIRPVQSP